MALRNPPSYTQGGSHPAQNDRLVTLDMFRRAQGVLGLTDLKVSQRGAGANYSVDIAVGSDVILSSTAYGGLYHQYNDSVVNFTGFAAPNATNPRIDRLVHRIVDASNIGEFFAVGGTPAASPVAPATPSDCIPLADVRINASPDNTIIDSEITDLRPIHPSAYQPASLKIADITLGSDAASIDFNNIPSGFKTLEIVTSLRGTAAAAIVPIYGRINGTASNSYDVQETITSGATVSAAFTLNANQLQMGTIPAASSGDLSNWSSLTIRLFDASATGKRRGISSWGGHDAGDQAVTELHYATFFPFGVVSAFSLFCSSGLLKAGSSAQLYGLN